MIMAPTAKNKKDNVIQVKLTLNTCTLYSSKQLKKVHFLENNVLFLENNVILIREPPGDDHVGDEGIYSVNLSVSITLAGASMPMRS